MTLLTRREVAAMLRVSTRTVDAMCRRRELPFSYVRSRKRFRLDTIESYLAARTFGHLVPPESSPRNVN